ncbi:hypothetical protein RB718 [Rhodopirellula baltica SH 1]|uniref:Uncharacterized protein n=1 Tax=Rhodopirellula baltica (strain DSM 10527 / NCIMB 13988 / SH1) TaxID=243090 RepID=Q7UYC7_RHOBA|nr:hypothetical protein RB718 [Rhodopirellula baltica SH 1]
MQNVTNTAFKNCVTFPRPDLFDAQRSALPEEPLNRLRQ